MPLADIPAAPVLAVMALGVLLAAAGHARHSPRQVALGLAFLFLSTALMMVFGFQAYQGDEVDPRPVKPPSEPGF